MIDFSLTEYIKIILLGGLLGTTGMTSILYLFDKAGLANGDMVRAIGSLLTKSYEKALIPGLIIHLLSGLFFTLVYALLIDYFNSSSLYVLKSLDFANRLEFEAYKPFNCPPLFESNYRALQSLGIEVRSY